MPDPSPYNEQELLEKISAGDEHAFAALFRQYHPGVYRAGVLVTGSSELAEEIVQDVFLQIWMDRDKLTGIRDFHSYFFVIARNRAYRTMRREMKFQNPPDTVFPNLPDEIENKLIQKDLSALLDQAIDKLPAQQKQVFILSKKQGLKREEVAALMQISPETVKSYLSVAMLNVRSFCMKNGHDLGVLILINLLLRK